MLVVIFFLVWLSQANPNATYIPHEPKIPDKPLGKLPERVARYRYGVPESNSPVSFRLAFAGPKAMRVLWDTDSGTSTSTCNYGLNNNSLVLSATGFNRSYGYTYTHVVLLSNLASSTRYFYQCGDATAGFGPINSFVTQPPPGSRNEFSVGVVGDMGWRNGTDTSAAIIKRLNEIDWMLHVGDLGYADDAYLYHGNYEQTYAEFLLQIEPIASQVAYMACPGNHEDTCNEVAPWKCVENLRNFTAYRTRWEFPFQESGGNTNMWYSFDYNMVHFVQVNTETDFPDSPEGGRRMTAGPFGDQLAWLTADLEAANANRDNIPWIVVSGHRPVWYSGGQDKAVNDFLLNILMSYKVDVYFSGHEHNYERYYPIDSTGHMSQPNYQNPSTPIYIVHGAGGNVEGHQKGRGAPDYLAYRNDINYGWAKLTFYNRTNARWEFYNTNNAMLDSADFYKAYD